MFATTYAVVLAPGPYLASSVVTPDTALVTVVTMLLGLNAYFVRLVYGGSMVPRSQVDAMDKLSAGRMSDKDSEIDWLREANATYRETIAEQSQQLDKLTDLGFTSREVLLSIYRAIGGGK